MSGYADIYEVITLALRFFLASPRTEPFHAGFWISFYGSKLVQVAARSSRTIKAKLFLLSTEITLP